MRSTRRGRRAGQEFGGSGEDSFVAVVVTKLTGALLFILLLTMTILVLIPRAQENQKAGADAPGLAENPLRLTTPDALPEAIAGRPYTLALSAAGGAGPLRWSIVGELPEGLLLDSGTGQIQGTPAGGTPSGAVSLVVSVSDGNQRDQKPVQLVVLEPAKVLGWVDPNRIRPAPSWRSWVEHGFGFLVLGLVGTLGLSLVGSIERWSHRSALAMGAPEPTVIGRRFLVYRTIVVVTVVGLAAALVLWLVRAG